MDGPINKPLIEFIDMPSKVIFLGAECIYFGPADPWEFDAENYGCISASPDDAAPIPVSSAIDITSPGIVDGETHYERKKRYDEELIEKNRKNREEIKRILGQ